MSNPLLNIGMDSNRSQFMARQRIEIQINLPRLFAAIDADPGIVGAGVVYIDADFNVVTLREFKPVCSIMPKRISLREAQKYIAPAQFADQVTNNPRESRLVGEAVNTTLSCGGAILGWIVVFSGTVAVPFTGGASLVVAGLGATAAAASTAPATPTVKPASGLHWRARAGRSTSGASTGLASRLTPLMAREDGERPLRMARSAAAPSRDTTIPRGAR